MNVHGFVSKGEHRFKDKDDRTAELQVEGMKIVINMETDRKNTLCAHWCTSLVVLKGETQQTYFLLFLWSTAMANLIRCDCTGVFDCWHPYVGHRSEQETHGSTRVLLTCLIIAHLQHNGASFHPLMTSRTHRANELMASKDSWSLITTLPISWRGGGGVGRHY